jgi:endonuclease-8
MPEGPSIVILKEECAPFIGKKILRIEGNSKVGIEKLQGQTIIDFKSWGKNFFICFKNFSVRIHLMLFGSYRINEQKETPPRLSLQFKKGEINFYTCVVEIIEESLDERYDWERDVMNPAWKPRKALATLKEQPKALACDVLLDQHIFAGVGNIIKNEVLFRIKVHPLSTVKGLPAKKLSQLVKEARDYSYQFYEWKKKYELKKHWLAHKKKICPRCHIPLQLKYLGKTKRRTFYCDSCQVLYK